MCVCVCVSVSVCVCACKCALKGVLWRTDRDRGGREASEAKTERKGETERGRQTRRQEERQTVVPPVVEGDAGSVCAFVCAWG